MLLYRSFRFAPIRGLLQFNQGTKCEQLVLLVTGVQELLPEEKPETNEQDINRKLTVVVKNWQLNHIYIYIYHYCPNIYNRNCLFMQSI